MRAVHYRQRAAEMLELARRTQNEELRVSYLSLAKNWELLAERVQQNRLID